MDTLLYQMGKNIFKFEQVCNSADEYKTELIKHAKKYRNYEIL